MLILCYLTHEQHGVADTEHTERHGHSSLPVPVFAEEGGYHGINGDTK